MKKLICFCLIIIATVSSAQDLTNKEGAVILPQAKDWSIGLDATRLIKDAAWDFVSASQAIVGKYMKDAHTAYRMGVRIGINTYTTKELELDRLAATSTVIAFPAPQPFKQNQWQRNVTAFGVNFGIEKRRGTTRLQGIYGVEGAVYISTINDKFSYGNALNANPSSPITVSTDDAMSSVVFGSANNVDSIAPIQGVQANSQGAARILQRKNTAAVTIGARLFIGAEYFLLPKMSIGGEFGWGFGFSSSGRQETRYESIGQSNIQGNTAPQVGQTTVDSGTSNTFHVDTDNSSMIGGTSASLRLNIYF